MRLVDTHCHLTSAELYRQLWSVWDRAHRAGISRLITVAVNASDSRCAIDVADQFEGVSATVGIHPHEAAKVRPEDWVELREIRHHPRVVAWGEIGLDYHYHFAEPAVQQAVLRRQLLMAKTADLPVILHCREAMPDMLSILDDMDYRNRRVVFHCFGGTSDDAKIILDRGWWLSFTGVVTFKNAAELQQIVRDCPMDRFMLETDAPYMTPEPHRKVKPNEPHMLIHLAHFVAKLKNTTAQEIAEITTSNAEQFFGLV